jgi:hypothetical protein
MTKQKQVTKNKKHLARMGDVCYRHYLDKDNLPVWEIITRKEWKRLGGTNDV